MRSSSPPTTASTPAKVTYNRNGGINDIGLANGTYYVIEVSDDPMTSDNEHDRAIKLAVSQADANAGIAVAGLVQPANGALDGHFVQAVFALGDDATDPTDDTVNEARQDAINDQAILTALRAAMDAQLGAQNKLAVRDTVATESVFTTDSGRLALAKIANGDRLIFNVDHSFKTGDKVIYERGAGTNIGLTDGTYYAIELDDADADHDRAIKLALTEADATAGSAIASLIQPAAGGLIGQSVRPMFEVVQGTTVKLAAGYTHGGQAERVYRYIGPAPYVATEVPTLHDLATENYASSDWLLVDKLRVSTVEAGKSWVVISPDGTSYLLERTSADGAPLTLSVGKNTISAVSAAASLAVGVGGTAGIAVAGAGAVAQNVVLGTTNAFAEDSILHSAGDVSVSADSSSAISSTVVALSAAVGVGSVGVGASIGVAVARNFIGWEPGADAATALQVQAYLEDTPVNAAGNLSLHALADQTISSFVLAGSVAIGAGGTAGIGAAGSGVFSENRIGVDVSSAIRGTGVTPVPTDAAAVTVNADDTSQITAFAGAIAVAAGLGGTVGGALSIGVSIASNTIDSKAEAAIDGAGVHARLGAVAVTAADDSHIHAVAAAASLAIGGGGTVGLGIAGAGALAQNTILGGTTARISHSDVASVGSVTVHAQNTSDIDATIVAASIGVGAGVAGGIGASIGVALARNLIGGALDTNPAQHPSAYASTANVLTLRPGDKVRIVSGPRTGDVYQYLGTQEVHVTYKYTTADQPASVVAGERVFVPGTGGSQDAVYEYVGNDPLDLSGTSLAVQDYTTITKWRQVTALQQDYANNEAWNLVNLNRAPLEVLAFVEDSSILTGGALSISAKGEQTIDAFVLAGSVAIAGGGTFAVSASGAGASSDNRVTTDVAAFIDGDRTGGISATSVSITASNLSHIHSDTAAVSVAAAFSGDVSLALAIGVSLATNLIDSTVDAYIANADVTARTGGIAVSATEDARIDAVSVAASLAVSISLVGIGISGAGALADNFILGKTHAHAIDSELQAAGNVSFTAQDISHIDATIVAVSLALGVGPVGGLGIAIGAAVARNFIGYRPDGTRDAVEVIAETFDTGIIAGGDLVLSATSQQSIDAAIVAASVAIAGGATFGVAGAGSGAAAQNRSAVVVKSAIDGDGVSGIEADTITLTAHDQSTIDATVAAVAVAVSFGIAAVAVSIGIALADNEIHNEVEASISNADTKVQSRTGGIVVDADETSTINTSSIAVAVAAAIGLGGAATGAGARSSNLIDGSVDAFILNSPNVQSAGAVSVTADDTATVSAAIVSVSVAAGLVGVAVGVSIAENTIADDVSAAIGGSSVTANGDIKVTANYVPTVTTTSVVSALAAGVGAGTGAGAASVLNIDGTTAANVDASTLTAVGHDVLVEATSTATADPSTTVVSLALGIGVSIAAMTSDATIGGDTKASATGASTITASRLDILAEATNTATPTVTGVTGGAVSGAGARSTSTISRNTDAFISDDGTVSAGGGPVTVSATTHSLTDGDSTLVDTSIIGVAAMVVESTISGHTIASIGANATVSAGDLSLLALAVNTAVADPVVAQVTLAGGDGAKATADITDKADTEAKIGTDAQITLTGALNVSADATNKATGSAKGGSGGLINGVAMFSDVNIGAGTTAQMDGDVLSSSKVTVEATAVNDASSETLAVAVGLLGAGAGTGATANVTSDADVVATVGATASIRTDGKLLVKATTDNDATVSSQMGSGGIVGIAAGHTLATVGGALKAELNGDVLNAASVDVIADGSNDATAHALAISISLGGAAGANAYAEVTDQADVEALVGSTASLTVPGGAVQVLATSDNNAVADALGATVSGVAINVMLPTAKVGGGTKAGFDGTLTTAASLDVKALAENTADAKAIVANVSFIGGGSGATAKAEITSAADVEALVGSTASITTTGAVLVDARLQGEKNHANARAEGGVGSIFAAVSVMLAEANVGGGVAAALDGDVLGSSHITVQADGANNAEAHTLAVSIGAFAGAGAGSNATVTEDADVEARVGATASLTTSGALKVEADGDNDAFAESDMGSGGVVGVTGGSLFAIVGGGVKAELDGDVTNAASVTVQADGFNNAKADALAIAIGLVAGSGASAYAEVTDQADVEALVGSTASLTVPGGAVQVLATSDNDADADALVRPSAA